MRPRNSRKAIAELGRICRANGIDLEIARAKGKGSHQTIFFQDRKGGERVRIVIAGGAEISSGVQRGMLSYLKGRASHVAIAGAAKGLAEAVADILDAYFNG